MSSFTAEWPLLFTMSDGEEVRLHPNGIVVCKAGAVFTLGGWVLPRGGDTVTQLTPYQIKVMNWLDDFSKHMHAREEARQ